MRAEEPSRSQSSPEVFHSRAITAARGSDYFWATISVVETMFLMGTYIGIRKFALPSSRQIRGRNDIAKVSTDRNPSSMKRRFQFIG